MLENDVRYVLRSRAKNKFNLLVMATKANSEIFFNIIVKGITSMNAQSKNTNYYDMMALIGEF